MYFMYSYRLEKKMCNVKDHYYQQLKEKHKKTTKKRTNTYIYIQPKSSQVIKSTPYENMTTSPFIILRSVASTGNFIHLSRLAV